MAYYVYHLVDPRSDEVFYIGKGKGNRIERHEKEARKGSEHPKCDVIRSIWGDGLQVKRIKVKQFASEQAAYDFEREEVRRVGLENLTNLCDGGGTAIGSQPVEPIYSARVLLKYVARVMKAQAAGLKFNKPWQQVVEEMIPHTLSRLAKKYGEQFLSEELAKHKVNVSFSKVDGNGLAHG